MMTEAVTKAARIIREGGTILYPTDTIWGIGCDATDPQAVQKIYRIKQRSDRKSMLVLMDDTARLHHYLNSVPKRAEELIRGDDRPTTIIYPGSRNFAENLPSEDGSIGIRMTTDPFCRALIQITGKPIVSTSANISGELPPKTFHDITQEILQAVDLVVPWRQEDENPASPSRILQLDEEGRITVIRP